MEVTIVTYSAQIFAYPLIYFTYWIVLKNQKAYRK